MKKIIFSFILGIGFGAYGYAAHKPVTSQLDQKEEKAKTKKAEQYDFSLFKFVTPKLIEEKDSVNKKTPKSTNYKEKNSTTYHYEKPLTFFRLS